MSQSELIVDCLNHIIDGIRCIVCDKFDGGRARYPCGHSACNACVSTTSHCPLCLTPAESKEVLEDKHLTDKVHNIEDLLEISQDTFKIDVFKSHRLSEQLKIEKQIFPKCIQAPLKYCNKRKSLNVQRNKHNIKSFLGEQITPVKALKMENSLNHVQQWLDKNEKNTKNPQRTPFADLNVNVINNQREPTKNSASAMLEKVYDTNRSSKKREHFKTTNSMVETQSSLYKYLRPIEKGNSLAWGAKKLKSEFAQYDKEFNMSNKNENDESGIVVDEDCIVIDDSQSQNLDKDELALQAVLEADGKTTHDDSCSSKQECKENVIQTENMQEVEVSTSQSVEHKVPFIKKGPLREIRNTEMKNTTFLQSNDIVFTIESECFYTTVNVKQIDNCTHTSKHSTGIQTDLVGELSSAGLKKNIVMESDDNKKDSIDLFHTEEILIGDCNRGISDESTATQNNNIKQPEHLVIADSDTDDDINHSRVLVTAEVHRSSDQLEYGVLTELNNDTAVQCRRVRGPSPASTDSSEKENYDPNRDKKNTVDKKKNQTKKLILRKRI